MDLVLAWLLFPAVAVLVCLGAGLLIERLSGARLPGALLVPLGLAGVMAATQLTTQWDWSAELTLPLALALALAGHAIGWRRWRLDRWAAAAVAGVSAVLAAPVVLSGDVTFAGYTVLGDTAIHMIGADALLEHGRQYSALPPSTYEFALVGYYGVNGYPSGGPVTAGLLTSLVGQDVAWTFQAFLTLLVAGMALALWSLVTPYVESRRLRALVVFIAAQPALVVAYALQGSVKEVGTVWGVALLAALVPVYAARPGVRAAIPLGVAAGALVAIVGPVAALWVAPLSLVALVASLWRPPRPWRTAGAAAGVFLAAAAIGALQGLIEIATYVEVAGGVVTSQLEFGNLLRPLDPLQKFGIWIIGDYRLEPVGDNFTYTKLLIGVAVGAIFVAALLAWRRRAWAPAAYVLVSLAAYLYVTREGSPWADGKALMIVSPALLLAACLGAAWLRDFWRGALTYAVLGALALGVAWSNALAYHDVSVAPRDRMEELDSIGERLAGQGPTLYTEFEEFAKHFLRDAAPEGPSEGYQRRYALTRDREGNLPGFGFTFDIDRFTERYVTHYRTIVIRRGFASSRPPSMYRRVHAGEFYDVWQRRASGGGRLLRHLPVGFLRVPALPLEDCAPVRDLADEARRAGGVLRYVPRAQPILFTPSDAPVRPPAWGVDTVDTATMLVRGPGRVSGTVDVPVAGRYAVWLEASAGRGYSVRVDGLEIGELRYHLNGRASANQVAEVELTAGAHDVELVRGGGSLRPGSGGLNRRIGPLALVPAGWDDPPVRELPPRDWRRLCGMSVDWVEAIAPA